VPGLNENKFHMYPTLFHIPHHVFGMPLFGVGVLLGIWTIFAIGLLARLAYRQGFNADTLGFIPILLIVGAIIVWLLPMISDGHGLPIRGFGIMMLAGVLSAAALAVWRAKRVGIDSEQVYSLALWMIIPGIIAARAFYVIEYWSVMYWPAYEQGGISALLSEVLNITQGGLVVYGAFTAGMAGLLIFAYRHKIPALALADLLAPSMVLGLAFGRLGCLMNGCCYGDVCNLPWAITFPQHNYDSYYGYAYLNQAERGQMYGFTLSNNAASAPRLLRVEPGTGASRMGLKAGDTLQKINDKPVSSTVDAFANILKSFSNKEPLKIEKSDHSTVILPAIEIPQRSLSVHPTQIYSAIDAIIICLLLLAYEPFRRRDGELLALMMSIYPVTRFLIEILRTDEAAVSGTGMTISQNISLAILILAAGLWIYILRRPTDRAAAESQSS
jgi:phosphatidylglycerol---prolipoprotein diacylglyceryl transferase